MLKISLLSKIINHPITYLFTSIHSERGPLLFDRLSSIFLIPALIQIALPQRRVKLRV